MTDTPFLMNGDGTNQAPLHYSPVGSDGGLKVNVVHVPMGSDGTDLPLMSGDYSDPAGTGTNPFHPVAQAGSMPLVDQD